MPADCLHINQMMWSPYTYNGKNHLWIAYQQQSQNMPVLWYLPWPRTSLNYNDFPPHMQLRQSGEMYFPRWTGEFPELTKVIGSVVADIRSNHPAGLGTVAITLSRDDYGTGFTHFPKTVTYSSIPLETSAVETIWVPDDPVLQTNGLAFDTKLTIDRLPGASYPTCNMTVSDHFVLHEDGIYQGIYIVGTVPGADPKLVGTAEHNCGIKRWVGDRWYRLPILADRCVLVGTSGSRWVRLVGSFFDDTGQQYGICTYDFIQDVVSYDAQSKGYDFQYAAKYPGTTNPTICAYDPVKQDVFIIPSSGAYLRVGTLGIGRMRLLAVDNLNWLLIGNLQWSDKPYQTACFIGYDASRLDSSIDGNWANSVNCLAVDAASAYIGAGTSLGKIPNYRNAALPITPIAAPGGDLRSISTSGLEMAVATDTAIYTCQTYNAPVWIAQVASVMTGINKHTQIAARQLWWSQPAPYTVQTAYGSNDGTQRVMQLGYSNFMVTYGAGLPEWTPIVRAIGIKHLEIAPYLRQYSVEGELGESLRLRDGSTVNISVEQQYRDLQELCSCNEIVTVVIDPGTSFRGLIGNLQMMPQLEDRDPITGRMIERHLAVSFTISEVVSSHGEAVPYRAPRNTEIGAQSALTNGGGEYSSAVQAYAGDRSSTQGSD